MVNRLIMIEKLQSSSYNSHIQNYKMLEKILIL